MWRKLEKKYIFTEKKIKSKEKGVISFEVAVPNESLEDCKVDQILEIGKTLKNSFWKSE